MGGRDEILATTIPRLNVLTVHDIRSARYLEVHEEIDIPAPAGDALLIPQAGRVPKAPPGQWFIWLFVCTFQNLR